MGQQSASRLEGDRYQHLYSWLHILDLLDPHKEVEYVYIEHPKAGAADDVTVHPTAGSSRPTNYYQVKWHVNFSGGYTMACLIEGTARKKSLLQKFWNSWLSLRQIQPVESICIWLVSDWQPVSGDVLGQIIRGANRGIAPRFLEADASPEILEWRQQWQSHLQAEDGDFEAFVSCLRFRLGYTSIDDLETEVDEKLQQFHLKSGSAVQATLLDLVKRWIEASGRKKRITAEVLRETLTQHNLWAEPERIVIIVHNWAKQKYDCQPDFELDWTGHFDHQERRIPPSNVWYNDLQPQIRELEKAISQTTIRRIQIRGSLSLSTALVLGSAFPWTANYILEVQHRGEMWRSDVEPDPLARLETREESSVEESNDLLAVVEITGDASQEIFRYIERQGISFRAGLFLYPSEGTNEFSVRGNAYATAFAQQVRTELRRARASHGTGTTHLFYFGPQSLAILLGQKLKNCGEIQLYEYQNPGYTPSCILR